MINPKILRSNNGHFWMFYDDGISFSQRMDETGLKPLLWSELGLNKDDPCIKKEVICR